MSEVEAREQLTVMLDSFTAGSILHLLADIFAKLAENASNDAQACEQIRVVEHTLIAVGMGIDAAMPT